MSRAQTTLKRLILGRPMASGELAHTLLPKTIALPVFSSDPLSSVAYATQEILIVLGLVGTAALVYVVPVSLAVATLLAVVVVSYRQTVRAYPSGGGAYIVAHENLGTHPGLLAASALLIDYVLTVAVSVVAGVDAIISAAPSLDAVQVEIAVAFVLFVAFANLRGIRESGTLFAIPTYGFVLSIYIMLLTGFVKCLGGCPLAETHNVHLEPQATLTLFLVLRAFSQGTTALTGVEAISNGVPAFRHPQSKNAATTLAIMGAISISMFLGISWMAHVTHVHYTEGMDRTVIAQIAYAMFKGGIFFYVIQTMTAAILFLAANTAFADFPRLSSILAKDKFMPRQFMNRGDRLVFSNGIVILSALASLLIIVFDADLNRLIHLYLVGVFISFTLSQSGMVVHWRRTREPGWKRSALINGVGACVTGIVLVVVIATKFLLGAWIVVAAIPVLMYLMRSIRTHYDAVAEELAHPARRPRDSRPGNQHIVLFVTAIDEATRRAIGYARSIRPADVSAVTFDAGCVQPWEQLAPEIPLTHARMEGTRTHSLKVFLRERRSELDPDDFLSVIVPESLESEGLYEIVRHPRLHRLKASLLAEPGIQVIDIPIVAGHEDGQEGTELEPERNYVVVLVAGLHNATLQAIEFAETLQPIDLRAVTFGLDPEAAEKLSDEWIRAGIPHPLEVEDSPFRDIGRSLLHYVRAFKPDGVHRVVTVVIPEFVVGRGLQNLLHGQTALIVKRALLFEPGVVVASVPYQLGHPRKKEGAPASAGTP